MERCNEVPYDDTGIRPVGFGSMIRVWESNHSLLDWQTGECYPRDMGCGLLKEGQK